ACLVVRVDRAVVGVADGAVVEGVEVVGPAGSGISADPAHEDRSAGVGEAGVVGGGRKHRVDWDVSGGGGGDDDAVEGDLDVLGDDAVVADATGCAEVCVEILGTGSARVLGNHREVADGDVAA